MLQRLTVGLQEIDEMLASNLTVEDEDAVQLELEQLRREAVRLSAIAVSLRVDSLLHVPGKNLLTTSPMR